MYMLSEYEPDQVQPNLAMFAWFCVQLAVPAIRAPYFGFSLALTFPDHTRTMLKGLQSTGLHLLYYHNRLLPALATHNVHIIALFVLFMERRKAKAFTNK